MYYKKVNGEILLTELGHYVLSFFGLTIEDLKVMSKQQLIEHTKMFSDVLNDGKITKSPNTYIRDSEVINKIYGDGKGSYPKGELSQNYGDSGSYSRYFDLDKWYINNPALNMSELYKEPCSQTFPFLIVPKASKGEKNKGLSDIPDKFIPVFDATKFIRKNTLPDFQEFSEYLKNKIYQKYKHHEILANELGVNESLIRHWINKCKNQNEYPTPEFYKILKQKLDLDDTYDKQMLEIIEVNKEESAGHTKFPQVRKSFKHNHHPTVKPLKLFSYLITMGSREGDIILDPFCGSGTTLIAADNIARKYIGIEINKEYLEIAKHRLLPHVNQTKLTQII